jgi:LacI family transcriptional regulator
MKHKDQTPTVQDVADAAGVSTATVSRCLNFPDQVAAKTQIKVMGAVERLGYSPNFGARAMAARRTNTIGAIIPTMANAVFARGLQAFQEELLQHGFTMLVASTSYQPTQEEEQIRALVARGADALLLIGYRRDPAIYRFLETQGVPALITWAFDATQTRPSVGFDNALAMEQMAREVITLGHRRLGLISAQMAQNDRAAERHLGLCRAMRVAGLDANDLAVVETRYDITDGADVFEAMMRRPNPPTAVFCGNDVLAVGALRRARDMGLSVPADVSITGFDDIDLAEVTFPALTTVHVPHREMGKQAARALAGLVKDGREMAPVVLRTRPVLRDTLGPAPQ